MSNMITTRLSRLLPARVLLLLAVALLQTAVLAAMQPALKDYNARIGAFKAQIPAVIKSAEQAAENMLAHPEANLSVPSYEQLGFSQELVNRSGGLANAYPIGGWGRTPTKYDVVLLTVRSWEDQSTLMRKRVREYHEKGWTVTVIGSKAGKPKDLGADFVIDNGAPSGKAAHGRINALANITIGWMWCCEYAAAMSRQGKFPAVLQSICIEGGEDYDAKVQTPAGRRSVVDCPKAIPAGELSKAYLKRVETMIEAMKSDHVQAQVGQAADVIAGRLAKGGRVGMVGMGHIILEEVKIENKTPWLGFRAVGISDAAIKAYLQPGDLLVWMSYNGMNSIYEDYAKNIADAKVDLITCYAPDPVFAKDPPPTLAHIDQSWKLPDAEVPIPVFPDFMAPVSGIDVTLLLRMLDDETAARLRKVKVPKQTPVVLPPEFCQRIAEQIYGGGSDGLDAVRKWGFVDASGKETAPARYKQVGPMENGLAPVRRDGKWGYIDEKGAEVIAPAYETADPFSGDGSVAKVSSGGKTGLIDKTGKVVLPLEYDGIEAAPWWQPAPEFIMINAGGKWGLIDKSGKELISPRYDNMDIFTQDKVVVKSAGKFGVIAKTGEEVLPAEYDTIWGAWGEDEFGVIQQGDKWGLVDREGKVIVPPTYDRFAGSDGITLIIMTNGKWGAVNQKGEELIPPKYDELGRYGESVLGVKADGKWGAINMKTGREIIPPQYEDMQNPSEGMVAMKRDGKWGYLDFEGKEIIRTVYDEALPFQGENAAVKRDGKRLFIDKTGAEVPTPDYDYFAPGGDGFFKVVRDNRWGFTDKAGKEVVPPKYTFVLGFNNGTALVYAGGAWETPVGRTPMLLGGKWGLVDATGKEIVPSKYDRIIPLGDAFYAVGTDVEVTMPQP